MFRIGDITGFPSKKVSGAWVIDHGMNGNPYALRMTIHYGKEDGVRILLASGPEHTSPLAEQAINEISENLNLAELNGVLISAHDFAPLISNFKKPGEPLFPGWPEGDCGERIAWHIFQDLLSQMDYAIFLEGPEPGITSIPHAAIYTIDNPPTLSCHPELIKMMGHDLILEKKGGKGSLAIEAQREFGLQVLITQIDEADANSRMLSRTKEKVFNFLSYAGLVQTRAEIPERTFIAAQTGEVRSDFDGELNLDFALYDFLSTGQRVGTILKDKSDKSVIIETEESGYAVRLRKGGHVLVDDFIYSLLEVNFRSYGSSMLFCNTILDNRDTQNVKFRENKLFKRLNRV